MFNSYMYPLSDNKAANNDDKEIIESTSCVIDRKLNVPKNI